MRHGSFFFTDFEPLIFLKFFSERPFLVNVPISLIADTADISRVFTEPPKSLINVSIVNPDNIVSRILEEFVQLMFNLLVIKIYLKNITLL